MRFNPSLCFAMASILLVSAGCGINIGEHPSMTSSISVGSGCLNGSVDKISKYLHGNASEAEISGVWDCMGSSLALFENNTQGSVPGQYKASELKEFLERYFLRNFRIDDGLMAEIMRLKQTLLGGDTDTLTREDLERARAMLLELKTLSLSLLPYVPRLNPQDISGMSAAELEQAITALREGAASLGQIVQKDATPYTFDHLSNFMAELSTLPDVGADKKAIANFRNYLPVLQQLKKILVSSGAESDAQQMTGADWRNFMTVGADFYALYLRYIFIAKNDDSFIHGEGLQHLVSVLGIGEKLFEQVISRNGGQISFKNIDELLDTPQIPGLIYSDPGDPSDIGYFSLLGDKVCRQHVKDLVRVFVRRYMTEPQSSGFRPLNIHNLTNAPAACAYPAAPTQDTDGLRQEHLNRFWNYLQWMASGQQYAATLFSYLNPNSWDQSYPAVSLSSVSLEDLFSPAALNDSSSPLRDAATDLQAYLKQPDLFPLFHGDSLLVTYNGYHGDRGHSFTELSAVSAVQGVVNFVLSTYVPHQQVGLAASPEDIEASVRDLMGTGASRAAIEQFYYEFRQIGIDLKIFDPNANPKKTADKRFLEASLFTYHSDGTDFMKRDEAVDYVSTLLSTMQLSSDAYNAMSAACPVSGSTAAPIDVFGRPAIPVDCFLKTMFGSYASTLWKDMPGLYAYFESLPPRPAHRPVAEPSPSPSMGATVEELNRKVYRETFACLLGTVARSFGEGAAWVDSNDIQQYAALSHYIEGLFSRFDTNGDGFIDLAEAKNVFPLVNPLLTEAYQTAPPGSPLASLDSDYKRLAVLTYMMKYGEIPTAVQFIQWVGWDYVDPVDWFNPTNHAAWQFKADRARVMQIIGLISSVESTTTLGSTLKARLDSCFN
ncbi:MAG: hypothetical protein P4M08_09775 [Oligoflexia bacterium]|nr:hypothetical protein [Oligoflexia bacterium]